MIRVIFLILCLCADCLEFKPPEHVYRSTRRAGSELFSDDPFPTDRTFCFHADHRVIRQTTSFNPDVVERGDTVYVADWYLPWFIKHVHPWIRFPYILISNDTDASHPDPGLWDYNEANGWPPPVDVIRTILYDSKIAAWFCKNMVLSRHPKIRQIPIGQSIIYWDVYSDYFNQRSFSIVKDDLLDDGQMLKKHLLYMNMQLASHSSRPKIADLFKDKAFCTNQNDPMDLGSTPLTRKEFFQDLRSSFFTLAPRGYGIDTVRFWEALTLGCIPIVKHSELDDLYADLPVLFVDEWEDITEALLIENKNLSGKREKLFYPYWAKQIADCQTQVRAKKNRFSLISATQFEKEDLELLAKILNRHSAAPLLCIGALMGLRPFELVEKCPNISHFFIQDPWGAWRHEVATAHLQPFTFSPLFVHSKKMTPLNFYEPLPKEVVNWHVFFDLSYQRCNLRKDLEAIYTEQGPPIVMCGSCATDPYVKKVLVEFCLDHFLDLHIDGNIWYFNRIG